VLAFKSRDAPRNDRKMHVDDGEPEEHSDSRPRSVGEVRTKGRKGRRSSRVWEAFSVGKDGWRVCNHCDREFGTSTSTSSLRYHLKREHAHLGTDEGQQFSAKKADMLVSRFIADNCLPLHVTTGSDFVALVRYLRRGYQPPGESRLKDVLTVKMRKRVAEVMRKKMATIEGYSATLTSWTSHQGRPHLAVILHGTTSAFELESFMLALVPIKVSAAAALIACAVKEVLSEWDIDLDKIVSLTSDGARNMPSAVTDHLQIEWVYCLAHALGLSVRLALSLPDVKAVVKAARTICCAFRASSAARCALVDRQVGMNLPRHALRVDDKVRWQSTYEMLRRLADSRPAVSACLGTLRDLGKPMPTDLTPAQWSLVGRIADVLEHLYDATEFLLREKHPTIGVVMPIMLGTLPVHLEVAPADEATIEAFKKRLAKEIDIRWDILNVNSSDTLLLAIYLDPRFKDFRFVKNTDEREVCLRRASDAAASLVRTMVVNQLPPPPADDDLGTAPSYMTKINRLFREIMPTSVAADWHVEADRYLRKPVCATFGDSTPGEPSPMVDPLLWWRQRQSKFPRLSALARRYLSISCTSVPPNCIFDCGLIAGRTHSDESIALLAFLSSNQFHLPQ